MIQLRTADRHLTDGQRVMVASIRESSNVHYPPDSSLLESNAIAGGGASNCACSMLRARHAPRDRSFCCRPPGRSVGKRQASDGEPHSAPCAGLRETFWAHTPRRPEAASGPL